MIWKKMYGIKLHNSWDEQETDNENIYKMYIKWIFNSKN